MDDRIRLDGVNEDGLDYRAGWIEGLKAANNSISINHIRCKRNECAGLQLAHSLVLKLINEMVAKMRGESSDGN